jgi:hypothetical protein
MLRPMILAFETRGPHDHILLSLIPDSPPPQPGVPGSHIFIIPQEQGDPVIAPGTGFRFKSGLKVPRPVRQ